MGGMGKVSCRGRREFYGGGVSQVGVVERRSSGGDGVGGAGGTAWVRAFLGWAADSAVRCPQVFFGHWAFGNFFNFLTWFTRTRTWTSAWLRVSEGQE